MEKDRIELAWELRASLHTWLKENPRSLMVEVFNAFRGMNEETIRKSIYRMRTDGDVCMIGKHGRPGRFEAITDEIKPVSATRAKLSQCAIKTSTARRKAKKEGKPVYHAIEGLVPDHEVTITDPNNPAKTIHRGNKRQHPIPDQRGQGSAQSHYRGGCTALEAI